MADRRKPEEEEAAFQSRLERLEKGLDEPELSEPGDSLDGPIPIDSEEVDAARREGDTNALYRGVLQRDSQASLDRLGISMQGRTHGRKGAAVKKKNASDVHDEWRQLAQEYWDAYPDAPIKAVVEDIYGSEISVWEGINGDRWEDIQPKLKSRELDYQKAFGKVPKPRARSTIWAVIKDLAPKNQR